jgi:hypothetical protein
MTQDPGDFECVDERPYPLWWDYVNGTLVALVMIGVAMAVLGWMIGVTAVALR